MADNSHIEWTDATWNPVTGCSIVSPGCKNCYAMKLAGGRLRNHPSRAGLTTDSTNGPVWNGQVRFNEGWLLQPMAWRKPRMIFVCAHGDLFHEDVPDEWIDKVFAVMALTPQHSYQVLTKRSARLRKYVADARTRIVKLRDGNMNVGVSTKRAYRSMTMIGGEWPWPLPNVWLGVSTERQQEADERIPDLLATPAAVRFISAEPLLGPIDLDGWLGKSSCQECDDGVMGAANRCSSRSVPRAEQCPELRAVFDYQEGPLDEDGAPAWVKDHRVTLDQVIVGGESGDAARPMHPTWARSLRDQCAAAGVPFFFKQWGNFAPLKIPQPRLQGAALTAWPDGSIGPGDADRNGGPGIQLFRGTKDICGRHLDGELHDGFPSKGDSDVVRAS